MHENVSGDGDLVSKCVDATIRLLNFNFISFFQKN